VIRRRLLAIVIAVAASQLAGAAAPAMVCLTASTSPAGSDEIVCTCTHAGDAECPMHTHPKPAPPAGGPRWCAGCPDGQETALTAFNGLAAPIRQRDEPIAPADVSVLHGPRFARVLDVSRPPVSPPPRG